MAFENKKTIAWVHKFSYKDSLYHGLVLYKQNIQIMFISHTFCYKTSKFTDRTFLLLFLHWLFLCKNAE